MPRKKEPPLSGAEQRRRFEQLAREAGAQGSTADFKRIVGRIARPKKVMTVGKKKR